MKISNGIKKQCCNCKKGRLFKRCEGLPPIEYCIDFINPKEKGLTCLDFAIRQRGHAFEKSCQYFIKKEK